MRWCIQILKNSRFSPGDLLFQRLSEPVGILYQDRTIWGDSSRNGSSRSMDEVQQERSLLDLHLPERFWPDERHRHFRKVVETTNPSDKLTGSQDFFVHAGISVITLSIEQTVV